MKQNQCKHFYFVAGRSGGHLIPCFTIAEKLLRQNKNNTTTLISTKTNLEKQLASRSSHIHNHHQFSFGQVPYRKLHKYPTFIFQLIRIFTTSIYLFAKKRPERLISTGSYISIPVCIAAKLLRIPIDLYELNIVPGKAIKFTATIATNVYVSFKEAKKHFKKASCYLSDYPVRFSKDLLEIQKDAARTKLGLNPNMKTIFILGGSQGSTFINTIIQEICKLDSSFAQSTQFIHQTGTNNVEECKEFYKQKNIKSLVIDYYPSLEFCYQAADIVICRSGAGTLFETAFFKKPCITIPLQTSKTSHQKDNAKAFVKMYPKTVHILDQQNLQLKPKLLLQKLLKFHKNTT